MSDITFFEDVVQLRIDSALFAKDAARAVDSYLLALKAMTTGADKAAQQITKPFREAQEAITELTKRKAQEREDYERATLKRIQEAERYKTDLIKAQAKEEADAQVSSLRVIEEANNYKQRLIKAQMKEQRDEERALHQYRMQAIKEELEVQKLANASSFGKNATVGRALGAAAGTSMMMGGYNVAGGLYGAEKIAYMSGIGQTQLTALSSTALVAGGAIAAVGAAALGSAYGIYKLIESGSELSKNLADMSTLLGPVTGGLEGMRTQLNALATDAAIISITFNKDINDVVKNMKEALSTGIDKERLAPFMNTGSVLSNALKVDLQDSVRILTSFKDAYQIPVDQLGKINDKLFNLIDVGKVQVNQLNASLTKLLAPAAEAGISIESLFGSFATLTRVMTPYQGGTGLASVINHLITPSKEASKLMDQLGINFGEMAFRGRTAGREINEVLDEIIAKTGGNVAMIGKIFPEAQARKAIEALIRMRGLVDENTDAMYRSGTALEANNRQLASLPATLETYKNVWSNTVQIVGHDLQDAITSVFFGDKSAKVGALQFAVALEEWVPTLEYTITAIMLIGKGLLTLGEVSRDITPNLLAPFKAVWDAAHGNFKDAFAQLNPFKGLIDAKNDIGSFFDVAGKSIDAVDQMVDKSTVRLAAYRGQLAVALRQEKKGPTDPTSSDHTPTGVMGNDDGDKDWFGDHARLEKSKEDILEGITDIKRAMSGSIDPIKLVSGEFKNLNKEVEQLSKNQNIEGIQSIVDNISTAYQKYVDEYHQIKDSLSKEDQNKIEENLGHIESSIEGYKDKILDIRRAMNKELHTLSRQLIKQEEKERKAGVETAIAEMKKAEDRKLEIIKAAENKKKGIVKGIEDEIAKLEAQQFKAQLDERGNAGFKQRSLSAALVDTRSQLKDAADRGDNEEAKRLEGMIQNYLEEFKSSAGDNGRISGEKISDFIGSLKDIISELVVTGPGKIDDEAKAQLAAYRSDTQTAIQSAVQKAVKEAGTKIDNSGNTTNNVAVDVEAKIQGIDPIELKKRVNAIVTDELRRQNRNRTDQTDTTATQDYPTDDGQVDR